ncbi:MAG: energy transducer TonB [Planctomycetota bacterium]|nr:energy transducer TonB [Planctomycetota bacterium]
MRRFLVRADLAAPVRTGGLDLADVAVSVPDPGAEFGGGEDVAGSVDPVRGGRTDARGRGAEVPGVTVDSPPVRTFYVEPVYPEAARRLGVEGWVEVEFAVGTDGRVSDARVLRSSGGGRLDEAALAAIRRWMFRPALRGGRPVPATCAVRVVFRLEDR